MDRYFTVFHGSSHQEKVVSETNTFASLWPGLPSHAQTLLLVDLGRSREESQIKINSKWKMNSFQREQKCFLPNVYNFKSNTPKSGVSQSDGTIVWSLILLEAIKQAIFFCRGIFSKEKKVLKLLLLVGYSELCLAKPQLTCIYQIFFWIMWRVQAD